MIWLAAAIGALCALPVAADENPGRDSTNSGALFAQLDSNKDEVLTSDEIPQEKKGLFERLVRVADKNGDGKLSSEEFAAGLAGRSQDAAKKPDAAEPPAHPEKRPNGDKLFRRLDTNKDGTLTLNEVPEERRRMVVQVLKRLKKDNDAGLTREEFVRVIDGRADGAKRPAKPPRPGQFPPGGPPRGGLFFLLDADLDGKLSSDEMSAAPEVLKKLDKDGDGSVSADELMAAIGPPPDADK